MPLPLRHQAGLHREQPVKSPFSLKPEFTLSQPGSHVGLGDFTFFFFFLTLDHTDDFHIGQVQATAPKEPALASGPHLPDVCTKSIFA